MSAPGWVCFVGGAEVEIPDGPFWFFVVLKHPQDFPDHYVVRGWIKHDSIAPEGAPTNFVTLFETYEAAHAAVAEGGLTCRPRYPAEDPVIVEVWE